MIQSTVAGQRDASIHGDYNLNPLVMGDNDQSHVVGSFDEWIMGRMVAN
jgi:hypothetical protein